MLVNQSGTAFEQGVPVLRKLLASNYAKNASNGRCQRYFSRGDLGTRLALVHDPALHLPVLQDELRNHPLGVVRGTFLEATWVLG
jgi:hypothetical protein